MIRNFKHYHVFDKSYAINNILHVWKKTCIKKKDIYFNVFVCLLVYHSLMLSGILN